MTNPNIRKINKLYILHTCARTYESSLICCGHISYWALAKYCFHWIDDQYKLLILDKTIAKLTQSHLESKAKKGICLYCMLNVHVRIYRYSQGVEGT